MQKVVVAKYTILWRRGRDNIVKIILSVVLLHLPIVPMQPSVPLYFYSNFKIITFWQGFWHLVTTAFPLIMQLQLFQVFRTNFNRRLIIMSTYCNRRLFRAKMFWIKTALKTFRRIPVPALVLFMFFCGIFVISQYSNIRNAANTPFVELNSLTGAKSENFPSPADGHKGERFGGVSFAEPGPEGPTPPRWTYICEDNACKRQEADDNEEIKSLDVCWLTCGSHGSIWPFPKFQKKGSDSIQFLPENIQLVQTVAASEDVRRLIQEAFRLKLHFLENFPGLQSRDTGYAFLWPFGSKTNHKRAYVNNMIKVSIVSTSTEDLFSLTTDESYELSVTEHRNTTTNELHVFITASTFFGVRHGLETLSQLIALDASGECLQILKTYHGKDKPEFPYRGILIDSARNFVPLNILKRIVDGMSYNKLNVLHLHLVDSNSFAFHSNSVPQLTQYGALSKNQIYFPHEIRELVKYARLRGVKIIPELDAPSHAGNGWQFGKKFNMGDLAFYVNAYDDSWRNLCGQPPCGVLNPVNKHVYDLLERVYSDMLDVFDKDLFHMGGDEVNVNSWAEQPELKKWMKEQRSNGLGLWKHFQDQAFERLKKHSENVTAILWTSALTGAESKKSFLDTSNYIIQVWEPSHSSQVRTLIDRGFSLIMSFVDKFYLDWGGGTWLGREHDYKYHNWQNFYDTKVDIASRKNQVIGGEAPLWSEKTGPWQVEVKLWPRAAAFAENLWSNPQSTRNDEVYSRLNYHNYRMQQRGIPSGQLQPESCLHFNGHCKNPTDVI